MLEEIQPKYSTVKNLDEDEELRKVIGRIRKLKRI